MSDSKSHSNHWMELSIYYITTGATVTFHFLHSYTVCEAGGARLLSPSAIRLPQRNIQNHDPLLVSEDNTIMLQLHAITWLCCELLPNYILYCLD